MQTRFIDEFISFLSPDPVFPDQKDGSPSNIPYDFKNRIEPVKIFVPKSIPNDADNVVTLKIAEGEDIVRLFDNSGTQVIGKKTTGSPDREYKFTTRGEFTFWIEGCDPGEVKFTMEWKVKGTTKVETFNRVFCNVIHLPCLRSVEKSELKQAKNYVTALKRSNQKAVSISGTIASPAPLMSWWCTNQEGDRKPLANSPPMKVTASHWINLTATAGDVIQSWVQTGLVRGVTSGPQSVNYSRAYAELIMDASLPDDPTNSINRRKFWPPEIILNRGKGWKDGAGHFELVYKYSTEGNPEGDKITAKCGAGALSLDGKKGGKTWRATTFNIQQIAYEPSETICRTPGTDESVGRISNLKIGYSNSDWTHDVLPTAVWDFGINGATDYTGITISDAHGAQNTVKADASGKAEKLHFRIRRAGPGNFAFFDKYRWNEADSWKW